MFVVQCCEREQTEQEILVRRYTRKAERRHERSNAERTGAAALKQIHAGTVTLLALVGSEVIGLAVGAWLGLFVEGD